jgi:hypothetical protein
VIAFRMGGHLRERGQTASPAEERKIWRTRWPLRWRIMHTTTTEAIGTRSRVRRSQKATLGNPRDEQLGLYRVPKLVEME